MFAMHGTDGRMDHFHWAGSGKDVIVSTRYRVEAVFGVARIDAVVPAVAGGVPRRALGLAATLAVAVGLASGCSRSASERREAGSESSSIAALRAVDRSDLEPTVTRDGFGTLDGRAVDRYTLKNARGLTVRVITYGAIITELDVPDRNGKLADVVLGFESLDGYREHSPYFGAIVGRVANRIRGASFELNGQRYPLAANNGIDHLHGGTRGWDKVVWAAEDVSDRAAAAVRLSYSSRDGEEGYPGTVTARVTYALTNQDELKVEMHARTDRTTIVNLAQHSYFNLAGFASGSVAEQELTLSADAYTPGDPQIPDGRVLPVQGSAFDFTEPKAIGKDLAATGGTPGFDHNFVVRGEAHALRPVARLFDRASGRVMTLEADQPGVQLYTANSLKGGFEGKGVRYAQHAGVCLETQAFPNAINVPAWRDQVIVQPDREYQHRMVYRFSTEPSARTR
jgi:aldose 1-epimerase